MPHRVDPGQTIERVGELRGLAANLRGEPGELARLRRLLDGGGLAEGNDSEAVAVGPHVRTVKVGDTVLFNPEDRFEVEVHGEEYVILRERDIHAIASPRNDSGTGLYL